MNAVGASVWGRLLTWLDHDAARGRVLAIDGARRSQRRDARGLTALLAKGKLDAAQADAAFERVAHRIRASRILVRAGGVERRSR